MDTMMFPEGLILDLPIMKLLKFQFQQDLKHSSKGFSKKII